MSDVADILELNNTKRSGSKRTAAQANASSSSSSSSSTTTKTPNKPIKKPKGISREVLALLSGNTEGTSTTTTSTTAGMIPLQTLAPGLGSGRKFTIDPKVKVRHWEWSPFHNSAREDGVKMSHWVRQGTVVEDYAFARFNKPAFVACYTDEQYEKLVRPSSPPEWSDKADTDRLLELCRRYDCRWPVIVDRWQVASPSTTSTPAKPSFTVVELRARYFQVAKIMASFFLSNPSAASAVPGASGKLAASSLLALSHFTHDAEFERERLAQIDLQFRRTREDEDEENRLLARLQVVNQEITKLAHELRMKNSHAKRSAIGNKTGSGGGNTKGSSSSSSSAPAAMQEEFDEEEAEEEDDLNEQSLLDLALERMQHPLAAGTKAYIRSDRLDTTPTGPLGLGVRLSKKLVDLLTVLGVPVDDLVATSEVCDAFDALRRDALRLIALRRAVDERKAAVEAMMAGGSSSSSTLTETVKVKQEPGEVAHAPVPIAASAPTRMPTPPARVAGASPPPQAGNKSGGTVATPTPTATPPPSSGSSSSTALPATTAANTASVSKAGGAIASGAAAAAPPSSSTTSAAPAPATKSRKRK